ncbi:MAG: UDP-N-acetylglucosamine pyrophosphorylase [Lachnospiraceae bacterium]|nr:UDP-N-acetylglucosamine pyrophosphorylase [Lachnospiraceae bacterium]
MKALRTENLFDLKESAAAELLREHTYPWEALPLIGDFIRKLGETLSPEEYEKRGEDIWIARDAVVYDSVYIKGPCVIGRRTEVRHCAFIRGNALVGDDCVIGNSVELKNVIIFNNAEVPHYNYVGDSILGFHAHMGAGSITSNIKADRKNVIVRAEESAIETGLRKFGAMLGDHAEIGCNAVLNPGTVVGRNSNVYPVTCVRGFVPENSILKNDLTLVEKGS